MMLVLIVAGVIAGACLLTLMYALILRVPPFPSTRRERQAVVDLLENEGLPVTATIYELGCGWGGLLLTLARHFPCARISGIEMSPIPCIVAWMRLRKFRNVEVKWRNFKRCDLHDAEAVTAYLMMPQMAPLAEKFDRELRYRTIVVSIAFGFRQRIIHRSVGRKGPLQADVELHRWPATCVESKINRRGREGTFSESIDAIRKSTR